MGHPVSGAERGAEGFQQPAVDGRGGLAMQLLVDDGLDQRLKGRLAAGDAHGERPGALDQAAEFGIGGGEVRMAAAES